MCGHSILIIHYIWVVYDKTCSWESESKDKLRNKIGYDLEQKHTTLKWQEDIVAYKYTSHSSMLNDVAPICIWLSLITFVLNYVLEANSNVKTYKNKQPLTCMLNDWKVHFYAIPQQNVDNLDNDNLKTQINGRTGRGTNNIYYRI